jgi:hypothetical protein
MNSRKILPRQQYFPKQDCARRRLPSVRCQLNLKLVVLAKSAQGPIEFRCVVRAPRGDCAARGVHFGALDCARAPRRNIYFPSWPFKHPRTRAALLSASARGANRPGLGLPNNVCARGGVNSCVRSSKTDRVPCYLRDGVQIWKGACCLFSSSSRRS